MECLVKRKPLNEVLVPILIGNTSQWFKKYISLKNSKHQSCFYDRREKQYLYHINFLCEACENPRIKSDNISSESIKEIYSWMSWDSLYGEDVLFGRLNDDRYFVIKRVYIPKLDDSNFDEWVQVTHTSDSATDLIKAFDLQFKNGDFKRLSKASEYGFYGYIEERDYSLDCDCDECVHRKSYNERHSSDDTESESGLDKD